MGANGQPDLTLRSTEFGRILDLGPTGLAEIWTDAHHTLMAEHAGSTAFYFFRLTNKNGVIVAFKMVLVSDPPVGTRRTIGDIISVEDLRRYAEARDLNVLVFASS